jgi:RNA polymerase sigma factor (sigma-70 family)
MTNVEHTLVPDVLAATEGNVQAFERLVNRCQQTVSGIALAILRDLDASEEVAQEVFIYVWQQLNTLKEPASFLPWVRQITRYRAYNYLRDNRVSSTVRGEEAELLLESFADPDACLMDNFERTEQSLILSDFIDALPDDSREIVLLYYREEQSSQQVADLLGLSEANVRKKLQRVREALKSELLAKYGNLLLTTAPGVGFTTLIMANLTFAPPAAAAVTSVSASQSSGSTKLGMMFGGALLGAGMAAVAAYFGMRYSLNAADSEQEKVLLKRLRAQTIGFILLMGVLLTLAYEMTRGSLAPLLAMTLLLAGVGLSSWRLYQIIGPRLARQRMNDPVEQRRQRQQLWGCVLGIFTAVIAGYAGMINGLMNAGRW